jgi:hemoglobin-like flavoprotein
MKKRSNSVTLPRQILPSDNINIIKLHPSLLSLNISPRNQCPDVINSNTSRKDQNSPIKKSINLKSPKKSSRKSSRKDLKHVCNSNDSNNSNVTLFALYLTNDQKTKIKEVWNAILETKHTEDLVSNISRISLFYQIFYDTLFMKYPQFKTFFENKCIQERINILIKMMKVLTDSLSYSIPDAQGAISRESFIMYLKQLGAKHYIYGVEFPFYQMFSNALVETFDKMIPDLTKEVKDLWYYVIAAVSSVMIQGAYESQKGYSNWVMKYNSRDWKRYFANINYEYFTIYKKNKDIKTKVRLEDILELDTENNFYSMPYFFTLKTDKKDIYLATDTPEELQAWVSEINWRLEAIIKSVRLKSK